MINQQDEMNDAAHQNAIPRSFLCTVRDMELYCTGKVRTARQNTAHVCLFQPWIIQFGTVFFTREIFIGLRERHDTINFIPQWRGFT